MKRWIWLTILVLIASAIFPLAAVAQDDDSEEPVYTIKGTVDVLEEDLIIVSGVIVEIDGESDVFSVGDEVVLTVAPAGGFNPSELSVEDEVLLTGILLGDGETLQATELEVLDDDDEGDDDDDDADDDDDDDDDADDDDDDEGDDDDDDGESCADVESHPVGEALAEKYEEDYDTIMGWFCDGFGFGEIMLAAELASQLDDVTAEELLERKAAGEGWGKIMRDVGVSPSEFSPGLAVGRPDDVGPPEGAGPPDHAGPPEDAGPPDHAGPPGGDGPPGGGPPEK